MNGDTECPARVGAFFDLDGTLMAGPSLERRFFRILRYRRAIGVKNYFSWLGEAIRLAPRGIRAIAEADKMYLRGVRVLGENGRFENRVSRGDTEEFSRRGQTRADVPQFFPQAVERVAWHASQGHAIVIVSGTLEPLAHGAARALEAQVTMRGKAAEVHIIATRLEEAAGSWTGRIAGEGMFGEEKARAMRKLAAQWGLDLARSYAYGDSANDRWMLAAVGRPTVVNAGEELRAVARLYGWPEVRWKEKRNETQRDSPGSLLDEGRVEEKKRGIAGEDRTLSKNEVGSEKIGRMNAESLG
jgi:HAD superfamily hydrolase (TIGR01490 family)